MTDFLVKTFIKDYQNTSDTDVRTQYGVLSSVVGIICNVLLFAVKLVIGLFMRSLAIMADAFNNLSDAASSVISFVGVKMANKPADKEHPFGHGRIEYISALIVAFLVIEVGFSFFKSSKNQEPAGNHISMAPFRIPYCFDFGEIVDVAFQSETRKAYPIKGYDRYCCRFAG